jgi:hypothetical protein
MTASSGVKRCAEVPFISLPRIFAMIVAVVASLALGIITPAAAGILSQHALLAPQLHRGEILTWFGTGTTWFESTPSSQAILLACSVTDQDQSLYTLSRRIRVILPKQRPSATLERPSIAIGYGHEYALDGSPLNDDPICLIYSRTMFGSPPQTLTVGTTWHFSRPQLFSYLPGLRGTATVTKLDPTSDSVSLHIAEIGSGAASVDMTVSDGGVIEMEIERWDLRRQSLALPKSIADRSDTISWTRQQQSLAGLWNYPPLPLADIDNPNGHFISVLRSPSVPGVMIVRIWHIGPYIFEDLTPTLPRVRDVLLILGVIALVFLVGRVAITILMIVAGLKAISPVAMRRQLQVTGALALLAAAGSMWWVYH